MRTAYASPAANRVTVLLEAIQPLPATATVRLKVEPHAARAKMHHDASPTLLATFLIALTQVKLTRIRGYERLTCLVDWRRHLI